MRVELSRFIDGDLAEIAIYIARDNPRRAARSWLSFEQRQR